MAQRIDSGGKGRQKMTRKQIRKYDSPNFYSVMSPWDFVAPIDTASGIDMMEEEEKPLDIVVPTPKQIKEYLDQYVIGQEEAKKVMSVAVHNHYVKVLNNAKRKTDEACTVLDKSNILLLGETGSGKTYIAQKIAEMLDVPCYIQDCTKITESGYVGSDVEDCLVGLLRECDYDVERAEMGIVILDEIDKLAKKGMGANLTKDPSGEGAQQSLLKIVEGDLVGVPPSGGRKHPEQKLIYLNTKNILFIGLGAFVGIDDIVKRRMGKTTVGFNSYGREDSGDAESIDLVNYVMAQDIRDFGMIPEFVGRFPIITNVNKLTVDDLVRILREPTNSIVSQYKTLMSYENVELEFEDDALREVAKLAINLHTGARGLKNIMETTMMDLMYDLPLENKDELTETRKVTVTADYVIEKTQSRFYNMKAA